MPLRGEDMIAICAIFVRSFIFQEGIIQVCHRIVQQHQINDRAVTTN